jgi:hypothetical protein
LKLARGCAELPSRGKRDKKRLFRNTNKRVCLV